MSNEWYDFVAEPKSFLAELQKMDERVDLFTFLQEPHDTEAHHEWHFEMESTSILPVSTVDHWMTKQINAKTRNMVRKSSKCGLVLREVPLDDDFINGIVDIYNECPSRQGKKFWHYGIDFDGAKAHIDTFTDRSQFVGAFDGSEMIGFFKLTRNANSASLMQVISKISHRDKAPNNALLAKAVEMCADQGIPFLQYGMWAEGTLGEYRQRHGFVRFDIPRYYVPLTAIGQVALKLRLYRRPGEMIPDPLRKFLLSARAAWHARKMPGASI